MGPAEAGLAGTEDDLEPTEATSVFEEAASGLLANPLDEVGVEDGMEEDWKGDG